jgi:hypothetical protein
LYAAESHLLNAEPVWLIEFDALFRLVMLAISDQEREVGLWPVIRAVRCPAA